MLDTLHPTPSTLHPSDSAPEPSVKPKLLIVDDDANICSQMKWALAEDYEVFVAEDRQGALEIVRNERPAVVTVDLGLPPHPREVKEGFQTLSDILQQNSTTKVIVITGQQEREHALLAVKKGAYDFFYKPIQTEELKVVLRRALHIYQLERELREIERGMDGPSFEGMLGKSPQMQEVIAAIRRVATTDVPVLIMGETGTGKELVARAIHRLSTRSVGPLVAINCGAIPENLLESELFGHEKGAFTGAHIQRKGRIEMASGGTLLLDEVGELPLPLQVKLLRFLEEHQIERVGGRVSIPVNVRLVAATNTDLKWAIKKGCFREDLYYRLGVVNINLPPLRKRKEDIHLIANALQQRYTAESKKKITGFTDHAIAALQSYAWPGNIRELENRIRRAVIMAEGSRLTPADLELASAYVEPKDNGLLQARAALEKDMIRQALARHNGNITQTAAELAVSRTTLYERIQKHGIAIERT